MICTYIDMQIDNRLVWLILFPSGTSLQSFRFLESKAQDGWGYGDDMIDDVIIRLSSYMIRLERTIVIFNDSPILSDLTIFKLI